MNRRPHLGTLGSGEPLAQPAAVQGVPVCFLISLVFFCRKRQVPAGGPVGETGWRKGVESVAKTSQDLARGAFISRHDAAAQVFPWCGTGGLFRNWRPPWPWRRWTWPSWGRPWFWQFSSGYTSCRRRPRYSPRGCPVPGGPPVVGAGRRHPVPGLRGALHQAPALLAGNQAAGEGGLPGLRPHFGRDIHG